jgi:hypothetical protein
MRFIYQLSFLILPFWCSGQYIQSATLSAGGSMGGGHGNYYLSHVVSQSSIVVGTARSGNVVVRQGFKQPFISKNNVAFKTAAMVVSEPLVPIQVDVFPNPFVDHVLLRFSEATRTPTRLTLYDASASLIWERLYPENMTEISLDGFSEIRAGKYLLLIFQHGNPVTRTIIKDVQP